MMMKNYSLIFSLLLISTLSFGQTPFVSEIHYDNLWSDRDEGIEITGTPEYDMTGWSIVLYDGEKGKVYKTVELSGELPENGILWTEIKGIQNGSVKNATKKSPAVFYPDGVALVNTNENPELVEDFLSYEGTFTAKDGPAKGLKSTSVGVFEYGIERSGKSIQKTDAGWVGPITATAGTANTGLTTATLGIEENVMEELRMYPNPVSEGLLYVSFYDTYEKQVDIYSTVGKLVVSNTINSHQPIDVSHLSSGLYLVRIVEEGKIVTKKLVVK